MKKFDLDFSTLETIELPVKIRDKEYILREASGQASTKYQNAMLAATKLGPDGKPSSIEGMASTGPYLVSLCMFEVVGEDGTGRKSVPLSFIEGLPNKVVQKLVDAVKEISDITTAETEWTVDGLLEFLTTMKGEGLGSSKVTIQLETEDERLEKFYAQEVEKLEEEKVGNS